MSNSFEIPNILWSIRHLRQNQPRGVAYLYHCLKADPKCTITASQFADAMDGMTPRGARAMLHRLAALGYGKIEIRKYTRNNLPAKIRYAWANKQEYFEVLHFHPILDAFKALFGNFLKNSFSPIILKNNNVLLTSTQVLVMSARRPNLTREQKRELVCKFIKAGRKDLWEYFTSWWSKRDDEPRARQKLKERGLSPSQINKVLEDMFPEPTAPGEATDPSQSMLSFFLTPQIETASEELEHVIGTMQDLECQRDYWTDNQRRFWFALKGKYQRLCKQIKDLLVSVVRYDAFIKC